MSEFDLGALGWNPELAEQLEPGLVPGRVVAAHRAAYDVETADGAVRTRLPGRLLHESVDVAVGDWVGLGDGLIRTVLPRRSAIVRQAAGHDVGAPDARGERRRRVRRHLARPGARAAPHRALSRHDLGERRGAGDRADEG